MPTSRSLKSPLIDAAFDEKPGLRGRIFNAIGQTPQLAELFTHIALYITDIRQRDNTNPKPSKVTRPVDASPPSKKRRIDAEHGERVRVPPEPGTEDCSEVYNIDDITFFAPQRKRLSIVFCASPNNPGGVSAFNRKTSEMECSVGWKNIEHVVCLPVPEKLQRQYAYCLFPKYGDGISTPADSTDNHKPMVWIVPDCAASSACPELLDAMRETPESSFRSLINKFMNDRLKIFGKKVIEPDAEQFSSTVPQTHRKGEKAYHVKAYRGCRDGYLFFLPTGIIWVFKVPLYFLSFEHIASISYTSILSRTFNLSVTASTPSPFFPTLRESTDLEFSMIDQADFAGIDAYIRRHGLQNASMAVQRKAKKVKGNGAGKVVVEDEHEGQRGDNGDEKESELEKAARELEDAEDELEEDYDPGSEGLSEGEGTSDEDEDGGGGDGHCGSRERGKSSSTAMEEEGEEEGEEVVEEEDEEEVEEEGD